MGSMDVAKQAAELEWLAADDSSLAEAGCITVAAAIGEAELAAAFGLVLAKPSSDDLEWSSGETRWAAITRTGVDAGRGKGHVATVVIETNGFEGSRDVVLADASAAGVAASIFWNVNGMVIFACARRGRIVYSGELGFDDDLDGLPRALVPYARVAQAGEADTVAAGAAMVQKFTGVTLERDAVLTAKTFYPIEPRRDPIKMVGFENSILRFSHEDLLDRLRGVPHEARRPLAAWCTAAAVQQASVAGFPAVAGSLQTLSAAGPADLDPRWPSLEREWQRSSRSTHEAHQDEAQVPQLSSPGPNGTWTNRQDEGPHVDAMERRWDIELKYQARRGWAGQALRGSAHPDDLSAMLLCVAAAFFIFEHDNLETVFADLLFTTSRSPLDEWAPSHSVLPVPPTHEARSMAVKDARAAQAATIRRLGDLQGPDFRTAAPDPD